VGLKADRVSARRSGFDAQPTVKTAAITIQTQNTRHMNYISRVNVVFNYRLDYSVSGRLSTRINQQVPGWQKDGINYTIKKALFPDKSPVNLPASHNNTASYL